MNKTVPFNIGSDIEPELINNAIIIITPNGQNFVLSPVIKKPGRCFYDGTDLSVNISYNYQLAFEYEDRIISSTTAIPSKPEGVSISTDLIEIPEINSLKDSRSFREYFQNTIDVTWNNTDGNYYYLVIENVEDNSYFIDPTDVFGGLGINFEFTTEPTQQSILQLRPMIHYIQEGKLKVTIYKVNE